MMTELRVVLLSGHVLGCSAVDAVENGDWTTPWMMTGEYASEPRDSLGRRHPYGSIVAWFNVRCNSYNCDANAIVSCLDLETLIEEALLTKSTTGGDDD